MDISLDDFIKKNKIQPKVNTNKRLKNPAQKRPGIGGGVGGGGAGNKARKPLGTKGAVGLRSNTIATKPPPQRVTDARLKIINRTRSKIRDAREKLIQKARVTDAREKILKRQGLPPQKALLSRNGRMRVNPEGIIPSRTVSNRSSAAALAYMDLENNEKPYPDVRLGPPRPSIYPTKEPLELKAMDMDFEDYGLKGSISDVRHLKTIKVQVKTKGIGPQRPLLRSEDMWPRPKPAIRSNENLKPRLEPSEGYKIVVSNLQACVTHEDIKELFEDIGTLISSRVVRPGTAEVVYKNFNDAVAAVENYHNRQLDGQPMKCLLATTSGSSSSARPAKSNVVPDITAIHKALFK